MNMKLSDSEWQIMNALWDKHPATAREIQENLPEENEWAYTTIKTMLTRLVDKGALTERKRGNTSVYAPVLEQHQARRSALKTLIDQVFQGALEPMLNFMVEDRSLSKADRKVLSEILARNEDKKETET